MCLTLMSNKYLFVKKSPIICAIIISNSCYVPYFFLLQRSIFQSFKCSYDYLFCSTVLVKQWLLNGMKKWIFSMLNLVQGQGDRLLHVMSKVIHPKYSKHWYYTMAQTIDWFFHYTLPHTLHCICVILCKFHIWFLKQF